MKILITGGNGFLGSNLVRKLLSKNYSLYVFSNSTNNIDDILDRIQFDFGYADDLPNFKDKIFSFAPDVILYNGWSGGNSHKDINNLDQFYNNVGSGITFIEMIKDLPKKPKFIGFGTIIEYGDIQSLIDESYPEQPIDLYGLSKLTFKNYSQMLCKTHGIEWVWIRPGYTYGPGDVKTRLIPSIIRKCLKNEDIILDECRVVIDYLYIDDFIEFISSLILTNSIGIFNISSGNQYKLKDVINIIHTLSSSKSKITFDVSLNRKNTSLYMCSNNNKIIQTTNVIPKTNLETGLNKIIKYYKNENSNHRS
jgi:nucleoside-diphosphate-sugar epimerase